MLFFLKCFMIGIGKIIPGVSGALLAINFNIYEVIIQALTCFFDDWKKNLKIIIIFVAGVLLAMILGSGIILYLIGNYQFLVFMFFSGLIISGTYSFVKNIDRNEINIFLVIIPVIILLIFNNLYNYSDYVLSNNFNDCMVFFMGGVIEIVTSIVPGISGTAILIWCGLYGHILRLTSNIYNIDYVINNFKLYISYGLGMFFSLIFTLYLVKYLFKYHRNIMNSLILGLSSGSIIMLLRMTFGLNFSILELILGCIIFVFGLLLGNIFN